MVSLTAALGLILFVNHASFADGWRGIVPLVSTRQDVERLLGDDGKVEDGFYEYENESVHVVFSEGTCKAPRGAWDVPEGTVIAVIIRPKRRVTLSSMKLDLSKFKRSSGAYDLPNQFLYMNAEDGVVFIVDMEGGEVEGEIVREYYYAPAAKYDHLRCPEKRRPTSRSS